MYFNRKNTEQKNWRMIKKGKHFLFGCSLVTGNRSCDGSTIR